MNESQIDSLLEKMGERGRSGDFQSEEAVLAGFHAAVRRRRRRTRAVLLGLSAAVVCVIAGFSVWRRSARDAEMGFGDRSDLVAAELSIVQGMFPDAGVALVNGEITTFEHWEEPAGEMYLFLEHGSGSDRMTLAVAVADDDFIVLNEGDITGEILVNRCSEHEMVVEVELAFARPNGERQTVKDIAVLSSKGESLGIGSSPHACRFGLVHCKRRISG